MREILNSTEDKLSAYKQQLFDALCRNNAIDGLDYNPNDYKEKNKIDRDIYWETFRNNNKLAVEIADNDTSFRIYRANKWYKSADINEDGYYFYVELKFDENNPQKVLFQEVANRYGKSDKNIVTKFIKCTNFDNLKNSKLKDVGRWFVFSAKEFESRHEILSKEWQEELFSTARQTLSEFIVEMDSIYNKFNEWCKTIN